MLQETARMLSRGGAKYANNNTRSMVGKTLDKALTMTVGLSVVLLTCKGIYELVPTLKSIWKSR